MRLQFSVIMIISLLGYIAGCSGQSTSNSIPPGGAATTANGTHNHASTGPHDGSLIELGSGEYHAELVHDANSVTIYLLDAQVEHAVPIESAEITINLVRDGAPVQYKLPANPVEGDPAGKSSRFTLDEAELAAQIDNQASEAKLSLTIAGVPYRGEINHSHDHGHDHDHGHEH